MERYELVKYLGEGSYGEVRLARNKLTGQHVAIKLIPRGAQINERVEREIINHRELKHPCIIRFEEVIVTETDIAIVMEYASRGELFKWVEASGKLSEVEARYFFQQLICGVSYCHSKGVCHRDLKLENVLLDGSPSPRLKICDFGFSKSEIFHSEPNTPVGTLNYIAPEVMSIHRYDGKLADVWSCGVTLYAMLCAAYPFVDPQDPNNRTKLINRICNADYRIPNNIQVSSPCRYLLSRIFVTNPQQRITIEEIRNHPWFLHNLPHEFTEGGSTPSTSEEDGNIQSREEIMRLIQQANIQPGQQSVERHLDIDALDSTDDEDEDEETSIEFLGRMYRP